MTANAATVAIRPRPAQSGPLPAPPVAVGALAGGPRLGGRRGHRCSGLLDAGRGGVGYLLRDLVRRGHSQVGGGHPRPGGRGPAALRPHRRRFPGAGRRPTSPCSAALRTCWACPPRRLRALPVAPLLQRGVVRVDEVRLAVVDGLLRRLVGFRVLVEGTLVGGSLVAEGDFEATAVRLLSGTGARGRELRAAAASTRRTTDVSGPVLRRLRDSLGGIGTRQTTFVAQLPPATTTAGLINFIRAGNATIAIRMPAAPAMTTSACRRWGHRTSKTPAYGGSGDGVCRDEADGPGRVTLPDQLARHWSRRLPPPTAAGQSAERCRRVRPSATTSCRMLPAITMKATVMNRIMLVASLVSAPRTKYSPMSASRLLTSPSLDWFRIQSV